MRILFVKHGTEPEDAMIRAFTNAGNDVRDVTAELHEASPFFESSTAADKNIVSLISVKIQETDSDTVFTFNYFPLLSSLCQGLGVRYISWIYDFPCVALYSCTVINECNVIFVPDSTVSAMFRKNGINTVFYLPAGCDTDKRLPKAGDISFTSEIDGKAHIVKQNIVCAAGETVRGYADALISVSTFCYGPDIIEGTLPEYIINTLQAVCPAPVQPDGVETPGYIYSEYVFLPEVTYIEQMTVREIFRERGNTVYYPSIGKVNLNVTSRNNHGGIQFRAMDILANGGFLLTNYQKDFMNEFEDGSSISIFEAGWQIKEKTEYYLAHEKERKEIAAAGYEYVSGHCTFDIRADEIMKNI